MRRMLLAAALAGFAVAANAQPGPGYGPGRGGPMGGPMMGGPRVGADVTPGWAMMTPDERREHQEKMRGFKDQQACQAYMEDFHKKMQERAKQQGKTLPFQGPGPGCDFLRKQG